MFWCKVSPNQQTPASDLARNMGVLEAPESSMMLASVMHTFTHLLGFTRSIEQRQNAFGDGRAIPMMSYAVIEYLLSLDLSGFDILELGGGDSTSFWAGKGRSLTTLETGADWVAKLKARNLPRTEIIEVPADGLTKAIASLGRSFDAIIVDPSASRYAAVWAALPLLKPGGFILLDNADWYPNTAALLRGADLIQVDFPDFRPQRWFRCVTSLFLHPQFRARPLPGKMLPAPPIGGKNLAEANDWDRDTL